MWVKGWSIGLLLLLFTACFNNSCGDGVCAFGEPEVCPEDCPPPQPQCHEAEDCFGQQGGTCPGQWECIATRCRWTCDVPSQCNEDGFCDRGENPNDCPLDCYCGNGQCEPGEICAEDCVTPASCGDGICQYPESFESCWNDCGALKLNEDFEDGTAAWALGDDWQVVTVGENSFLKNKNGGFAFTSVDILLADFILEMDIKLISEGANIVFRSGDNKEYSLFIHEDNIGLMKRSGTDYEDLANVDYAFGSNKWRTLRISAVGGSIKVFIDQKVAISFLDDDPLVTGRFGLTAYLEAHFDNIEATVERSPFTWVHTNGPPTGDARAFAVSKSHPNLMYTKLKTFLYRSTDNGDNWEKMDFPRSSTVGRTIAIADTDHQIAYVGTNEGIYKTIDMGENWNRLLSREALCEEFSSPNMKCDVTFLAISPTDVNTVFVGGYSGLFLRTDDGGITWERLEDGLETSSTISKILIDPSDEDVMYVASGYWDVDIVSGSDGRSYIGSGEGIFKTINGGQSWFPINEGLISWKHPDSDHESITVNDIELHPRDPHTLYCLISHLSDEPAMFKTVDGGTAWFPLTDTYTHSGALEIDPVNPDIIYLDANRNDLRKSLDGGQTWKKITGSGLKSNFFFLDLIIDQKNPDTIYGSTYTKAILKSEDGGETWRRASDGIAASMSFFVEPDPDEEGVAYAGSYESALFKTTNEGASWDAVLEFIADYIYGIVVDSLDTDVVYAAVGSVGDVAGNGIFKSSDAGETWDPINEGFDDDPTRNNFYFIEIDPTDSDVLYTGTEYGDIYKSTDAGEYWRKVNGITTFNTINQLRAHPADSETIYAVTNSKFTDGGGVFTTVDGGASWSPSKQFSGEDSESLIRVSPRYAYAIAIDPENPHNIYSGDGFEPLLFRSADGGANYETVLDFRDNDDISGVRAIEVDSQSPNRVYAGFIGKEGGLYTSDDHGSSWTRNEQLTFSTIHTLTADPNNENIIYAAPWGGGLFVSEDTGNSWTEIDTPTISIPSIIVDPSDSNHLIIADRIEPKIYESLNQGGDWKELISLDAEKYYRISTMSLHEGDLYFSAFNKVTGIISLFLDGPMSGTTFKIRNGKPIDVSYNMNGNIIIDFFSNDDGLFAVSHIYGVYRLDGDTWADISPDVDMGFNNIIVDETAYYVAGGADVDLDLNHRVNDDTIVNNIYRSVDAGRTWSPMLQGNPFESGIKRLSQHPTQKNVFYAATGTGVYYTTDIDAGFIPTNTGLDFRNIGSMSVTEEYVYVGTLGGGVYVGDINPDYSISWRESTGPHPEIFNILLKADPNRRGVIYATSYPGGVFKSTDGGMTWIERNFAIPSFEVHDPTVQGYYSLDIDSSNSDILYLGIYGKGVFKSINGGAEWLPMYGSRGQNADIMKKEITQILVHPRNPGNVYLATSDGVYHSADGARTWAEINDGLDYLKQMVSLAISSDGDHLYAGTRGAGVWKTSVSDINWEQTTTMGTEPRVAWITINPRDSRIVYLGLNPSGVYKSTDGGRTWYEKNVGLSNTVVYPIELNPLNPEEVYVGTGYNRPGGYKTSFKGGKGIYRSLDGGERWEPANGGLENDIIVNDVIFDPKLEDTLYIGAEDGIAYMSRDKGGHWMPIDNNRLSDCPIYALNFDSSGDILYAGTACSVWKGVRN